MGIRIRSDRNLGFASFTGASLAASAAIVGFGAAGAIVAGALQTPCYRSVGHILVEPRTLVLSRWVADPELLLSQLIAKQKEKAETVAEALRQPEVRESIRKRVGSQTRIDSIGVQAIEGTSVIEISAVTETSDKATQIVNACLDVAKSLDHGIIIGQAQAPRRVVKWPQALWIACGFLIGCLMGTLLLSRFRR